MANPRHVDIVLKGSNAIDDWKKSHPNDALDLQGVKLDGISLWQANLEGANLSKARLRRTDLTGTRLVNANLCFCILYETRLKAVDLSGANLSGADLGSDDFAGAQFVNSDLSGADFSDDTLTSVDLTGSDMRKAFFSNCSLASTNLSNVNLSDAVFIGTRFVQVTMTNTNLSKALMREDTFSDCDLSKCIGLETIEHGGPSSIGIDTLVQSLGIGGHHFRPELELFFLNTGVPKDVLDKLPEILANVQYCTCFIAYGEPDKAFAEKLRRDLMAKGVSVWVYSLDSTPGERTWGEITQQRREAEKMIVLCSTRALIRDGVLKEIEEQIDENPNKLVPISLDDLWKAEGFLVKRGSRDLKPFLLERNWADFSDKSKHREAFHKLLTGLKRKERK